MNRTPSIHVVFYGVQFPDAGGKENNIGSNEVL